MRVYNCNDKHHSDFKGTWLMNAVRDVFTASYIKRGGTGFIIHTHAVCKLIVNRKPWEAYPVSHS